MAKEVFGTKEWASSNFNIQTGCEHNCRYCYARSMCPRHGKTTVGDWQRPVLIPAALNKRFGKRADTIMFPTTHDITPANAEHCVGALRRMLDAGNRVLVVSKPHAACVTRILDECRDRRDKILFRFTIGSADDAVLKVWEPGAPAFEERLASLRLAYERGFQTSVSCEPMLDDNIHEVMSEARSYVTDAIWLGKANFLVERLKMNGEYDGAIPALADQLLLWQSDERIRALYERYKDDKLIKWKESIKKVVGLPVPTKIGMDV